MTASFKDKVVIVTGGSNGVGAATVASFLEQGAKVVNLDIRASTEQQHDSRLDVQCDIASEESVAAAIRITLEKWNDIDVLVNVAGIMDNMARLHDTDPSTLSKLLSVNVMGPFLLMQQCIRHFLTKTTKHKGSIINICSLASIRGAAAGPSYTASKHALLGLSRNVSYTYAKDGIRTNVVLPGGVQTNMLANCGVELDGVGMGALGGFLGLMPTLVAPKDVASAVLWLAGAENVNGAEVSVDGGWSCA